MAKSWINQDTQIEATDSAAYDDTITAGSTMESGTTSLEDDLNSLRSQLKRYSGFTNWYDDIGSVRTQNTIHTDLEDIEQKRILFRTDVVNTDVSVPATQNFVVLSVAGSETPTQVAVVDAATTEGTVVAHHSGTFGTHSLDEVAGVTKVKPKNLCLVRDASTGQVIQSSGRDVFALLQCEDNTNGHTFDDDDEQVQLSFIRYNSTFDDFEACPVADIESTDINYSYVRRVFFDNIPEDANLSENFADVVASVDVTLDNAIDNQSGAATQAQSIDWQVADSYTLKWTSDSGATKMLELAPTAGGDTMTVDVDDLDIDNTNTADFAEGAQFDTDGTTIKVGDTAGEIEIDGAGKVFTSNGNDLEVEGGNEILFDDTNRSGWTATSVKLSEDNASWTSYKTAFGEVSLMDAIVAASTAASTRTRYEGVCTANISANTNVTGAGGGPNLDAQLGDYSSLTFVDDVNIYLNGVLMRNGADAAANHDVYPGDTPANGDLKFEFNLKGAGSKKDRITMEIFA